MYRGGTCAASYLPCGHPPWCLPVLSSSISMLRHDALIGVLHRASSFLCFGGVRESGASWRRWRSRGPRVSARGDVVWSSFWVCPCFRLCLCWPLVCVQRRLSSAWTRGYTKSTTRYVAAVCTALSDVGQTFTPVPFRPPPCIPFPTGTHVSPLAA